MDTKSQKMISQAHGSTSVSLGRIWIKQNVSALAKKDKSSSGLTPVNVFSGTEYLVIDGEWKRFNMSTIVNSILKP
jgi:hypothetical protein